MKRLTAVFAATLATVACVALATPAAAATGRYVALGDSYAAGSGAGAYYTGNGCQVSANAYPHLWAKANAPSSFAFMACGGATTEDVLASQVSALTSGTRLVTITIGGNDVGWGDALLTCLTGTDSACSDGVAAVESTIRGDLPGRLDTVYDAVRDRAPDARVVVLGYPHLYGTSFCLQASMKKRGMMNHAADVLHSVISGRATAYGFSYVDTRKSFATHEVCGRAADWIKGLAVDGAFHPNATGQRYGYLKPLGALVSGVSGNRQ